MGRGSRKEHPGNSKWAVVAGGEGKAGQNLSTLRATQGRLAGRLAALSSHCIRKGASGCESQASCLSDKDTRTKHNRQPRGGAGLRGQGCQYCAFFDKNLILRDQEATCFLP